MIETEWLDFYIILRESAMQGIIKNVVFGGDISGEACNAPSTEVGGAVEDRPVGQPKATLRGLDHAGYRQR